MAECPWCEYGFPAPLDGEVHHLARRPAILSQFDEFVADETIGSSVERLLPLLAETIPLLIGNTVRGWKFRAR